MFHALSKLFVVRSIERALETGRTDIEGAVDAYILPYLGEAGPRGARSTTMEDVLSSVFLPLVDRNS